MAKKVKMPGRIESASPDGIVTGAAEIFDDGKGKKQNVINTDVSAELLRLENEKQDNLTIDNVPTENSGNPISSGAVFAVKKSLNDAVSDQDTVNREVSGELGRLNDTKQDNLNFDNAPTEDSQNPVTSGGVYTAEKALSDAIEAILILIPSAATALNQLADKNFVESSLSTATATFRGTYNVVSDLGLAYNATHEQIAAKLGQVISIADNNDYCFVQVPESDTSTDIKHTERYKFNGSVWAYEYDLNNSGFTADQWAAINSNITAVLVAKLTQLPTAEVLAALLAGKQANLTFDNRPTAGSDNPVKSGGVYASENEIIALINALEVEKQDKLTFDSTPTNGSSNPVTSGGVYEAIYLVQVALASLDNRVISAEHSISVLTENVGILRSLYQALTLSNIIVGSLPATGVANTVYRVPGVSTYADWMYYNGAWVKLAEYTTLDGYLYKGVATPSGSPAASAVKMFYFALTAGTYTNFGGLVCTEGINILKYDGANWTKEQITYTDGGVFDISAYHAIGGTLATYADLSAALDFNNGGGVPTDYQKGGMSIKFVQSSDNNYIQARLMANEFTTDVIKWQVVVDEPTVGSDNLVKSGGIFKSLIGIGSLKIGRVNGTTGEIYPAIQDSRAFTDIIRKDSLIFVNEPYFIIQVLGYNNGAFVRQLYYDASNTANKAYRYDYQSDTTIDSIRISVASVDSSNLDLNSEIFKSSNQVIKEVDENTKEYIDFKVSKNVNKTDVKGLISPVINYGKRWSGTQLITSSTYIACDPIDVKAGDTLILKAEVRQWVFAVKFTNDNGDTISNVPSSPDGTYVYDGTEIVVPDGATTAYINSYCDPATETQANKVFYVKRKDGYVYSVAELDKKLVTVEIPTVGSTALVKSGGTYKAINGVESISYGRINGTTGDIYPNSLDSRVFTNLLDKDMWLVVKNNYFIFQILGYKNGTFVRQLYYDISNTDNKEYKYDFQDDSTIDSVRICVASVDGSNISDVNDVVENIYTKLKELSEQIEGIERHTNKKWLGKKIVWFGTSIPAGKTTYTNVKTGFSYPIYVGNKLGADLYNEAVGESSIAFLGFGGPYYNVYKKMMFTAQEELILFNNLFDVDDANQTAANKGTLQQNGTYTCTFTVDGTSYTVTDVPALSSYNDAISKRYFMVLQSYEMKLVSRHLIMDASENVAYLQSVLGSAMYNQLVTVEQRDLGYQGEQETAMFVIDHGHNDPNSAASLEVPDNSDNRRTFVGGFNILVRTIMRYNPNARIVVITDYDDYYADQNYSCELALKVAGYWHFPCIDLRKFLPFNINEKVPTSGYWDSDKIWHDDGFEWSDNGETYTTNASFNSRFGHSLSEVQDAINPRQLNGKWVYDYYPRWIWIYDTIHPSNNNDTQAVDLYVNVLESFISSL